MDKKNMFLEFVDDCICGVVVVCKGVEEHYSRQETIEMFKANNIEDITVVEDGLEIIHNNTVYTMLGV